MSGINQISHDGIGNVFWSNNDLYISASASQAGGEAPVTIADLLAGANPADTPALVGVRLMTVGVFNNSTGETITGLALASTGTTSSGGAFAINYPITVDVNGNPVSIASGDSQTFLVPIANGVLRTWILTPTFGTAPAAGSIDTLTTVQGAAGNGTVLKGSLVPQTLTPTPAALAASATYTSDTLSLGAYDKIVGSVFTDQTGTLDINQSYNGTDWDVQSSITVNASTPTGYNIAVVAPYQQLVYINGATAQTVFRLNVGGKTL